MNFDFNGKTISIDDNLYTKSHSSAVDAEYWYSCIFGKYPKYKCYASINYDKSDVDIFQVIHDDLIASCEFYDLFYEFNYDDNEPIKYTAGRYAIISSTLPVMISYEYSSVSVLSYVSMDIVNECVKKYLMKYNVESNEAKCNIIVKNPELYLREFTIKLENPIDFGLYNEGFEDVHKKIVKSINEDQNGLYLLYGKPGTGKTTYIRNLIKECSSDDRKFVYVPSNLFCDFTNPNFVSFLIEYKGCVFIIEDCESLITVDNGVRSAELTDLLNMTDGLLADALDMKIICTFNIDDGKIDEALLRPGRCKCRYEFELLDKDRANDVAKRLGLDYVDHDISLAELFNKGNNFSNEKKKKIGFR